MSRKGKRINWTEDMNRAVLECKSRAQEIIAKDCPINENGRKKGYIQVMKTKFKRSSIKTREDSRQLQFKFHTRN